MAAIARTVSLTARTSVVQGKKVRNVARTAAPQAARGVLQVRAASKAVWFPGNPGAAHLDGTLPGDYGFDPLSLGSDAEMLKWFQQAELMHCRWAMVGAAGILLPEVATIFGAGDLPVWFEAGEQLNGTQFTDGVTLFWIQMLLMNWVEVRRFMDMKNPGSQNQDPIFPQFAVTGTEVGYPGGRWFNPFSMAATDEKMVEYKTKEVKNGRLAMVAMVGFATQAFVTGQGPVANLMQHMADPAHNTFFTQSFTN
eukprot:CAMPEP_0198212276 /NCGR_PEP_ID=MMETSP1445-20131203/25619_1 /TAXON_ID=36898 /ORGANISM="Pyramimonas sp., Strain CCMP2087" /LENGTH=252 /DNA_ID=CAMNT_0043886685 /DNA_START=39 /DNA_END=797 /DNA_ORIENTATION=+